MARVGIKKKCCEFTVNYLIFKALAFHAGHDHAHDSETSTENEERDYLWKFLVASAAVYSFFLIETLTHLFFRKSIGHSHSMEVG